jgi:hypothetical protein
MAYEPDAPPVGEELHLPGPSLIPILNAAGVALTLLGLTIWHGLLVVGLLLFFFTLVRWIRDVVRDIGELPADHGAGH